MDDSTIEAQTIIDVRLGIILALLLTLAGCGTLSSLHGYYSEDGGPDQPVDIASIQDAIPKIEPRSKYGNPRSYVVNGDRYYVLNSSKGYVKRGIASWYGTKFHGQRTSSGEPYDMYAMTAAHKTLPLPTYAEVTNLLNGRRVIVKINDRGPFKDNRELDLSYAAAAKLGIMETGTGIIELKAIDPATYHDQADTGEYQSLVDDRPPSLFLQIGAFAERSNAERLISRLASDAPRGANFSIDRDTKTMLYRVRVGPISDVDEADRMSTDLSLLGISDSHIVVN
jgi:rare lipoprotein A